MSEILSAEASIRDYIAEQIAILMENPYFEYAVQGSTRSDREREELIFHRIDKLINAA